MRMSDGVKGRVEAGGNGEGVPMEILTLNPEAMKKRRVQSKGLRLFFGEKFRYIAKSCILSLGTLKNDRKRKQVHLARHWGKRKAHSAGTSNQWLFLL